MPDPIEPSQPLPPPPSPEPGPSATSQSTGLPSNVAAAIACIPLIGGIIFYILEKRDSLVRFYAMQSIIFGGAWFLFYIVALIIGIILGHAPVIGGFLEKLWDLVALLGYLAFVVLWVVATVKAFSNVLWEIPYIGPIARRQVEGSAG